MNNEMRQERAMQLKRKAEALRDKAGKVSTPLTEANAMCAKAKELETCAERVIADAAARAYDIPRLADEDTARPKVRGMNGYMPRVGELFQWSGVTFRRIKGELVERAIRDGERAEVLFPVRYVKAPNNPDLVGGRGLMNIAEAPNFIFEGDDACNDPVGHPLTCDCPFGPVANESSDE